MSDTRLVIVGHRSFEVPERELRLATVKDMKALDDSEDGKQHFCLCVDSTYKFDSNLLVVQQVCPLENHTEGSLSNLLPHTVVHTNDIRRRGSHLIGIRVRGRAEGQIELG